MSSIRVTKTFAIDLDSVLADTMIVWIKQYNKMNHTAITKNEITSWDIGSVLPISPDDISKIFNDTWKYRWHDVPPTEPELAHIIEKIHRRGYRISVLTKRERPTVQYVAKWLDYHDIYSDDLIFVYDNASKSEYPFDILIDDAPPNMADVMPPRRGILFNQPWNKEFDWPLRVNSLSEAEQKIL